MIRNCENAQEQRTSVGLSDEICFLRFLEYECLIKGILVTKEGLKVT
jgi:hypothetical protein